ncbi:uncharacterized protein TM35_000391830 [Trypanosoma theileri]|uniref:Uncharacterized protein n=1 Tax=Trypanosoma theileri TaxID=67003 RepID=A0A1X0NLG5_9TRYP|nr:uncharacterized protein TM35_000391830 [Trypanosoma theileri]ORC85009.1 hypothetical protein TM35_000391830 [Trypanosoma theileri]
MSFKLILRVNNKLPHQFQSSTNHRYVHTGGRQSNSLLWLSSHKIPQRSNLLHAQATTTTPTTTRVKTESSSQRISPHKKTPPLSSSSLMGDPSTSSSSTTIDAPPLVLDPPFTPVPGELDLLQNNNNNNNNNSSSSSSSSDVLDEVCYSCCRCKTILFSSRAYAPSSAIGQHSSGWPSFTSPVSSKALRLRSLLQRVAVERGSGVPLRATLAARGLRVEGEMVRRTNRGNCERAYQQITWREECLRDVNKRSDPAVVEGCCTACGSCVCRVTVERRSGVKYVVNPTAVVAQRKME